MSRVPEDAYQHLFLLITKLMFCVHNQINTVLLSSVLLRRCRQLRGHHEDILTINVYQKDLVMTCKQVLRFFNVKVNSVQNHISIIKICIVHLSGLERWSLRKHNYGAFLNINILGISSTDKIN